ncbi:DNA helicase II [compost metagenome]
MTRAREELHLSYAQSRLQFGQRGYNPPSRFLADMGDSAMLTSTEPKVTRDMDQEYFSDELPFEIGDRVRSAAFGSGEVSDIEGLAVTILFDSGTSKKLNAEYARLEKIG